MAKSNSKYIVILDYHDKKAYVRLVPKDVKKLDDSDIANYFESELKIHLDDCEYIVVDDVDCSH